MPGFSCLVLALLAENDGMEQGTHPPHLCYLTQCEERNVALHQRYLAYLVRFERWNKPKGWARFTLHRPLAAIAALSQGRELPSEWCRQPQSKDDFVTEIFLGSARQMGRP